MGDLPFERMEREVFVRQQAATSPKFGSDPTQRPITELLEYGIVNIDKPSGPTSHQISAFVQKILHVNKSGHSGTLDPKVTGILAVAIGKATRISQSLLTAGKEYICLMHLHDTFNQMQLQSIIKEQFIGKIKQLPPIKSAVKRQVRFRKIYYIEILEIKGQDVLFRVGCQAGTYIRKLCHDIGQAMGCGAHMAELRRTKAGPFNESTELCTLQDLTDAYHYYKEEGDESHLRKLIHPTEFGASHLPKIWIVDSAVNSLCNGASLKAPGVAKVESDIQVGELAAVLTLKGELVAVGETLMISKEMISSQRGVVLRSSQVFMPPGIYPKIDKPSSPQA
ncbi:MAG: RNA-guided pseudouridylation complex pseudouridine synthase subunit Cbf5 [Nanoarchaeota archaeon]|nr:RNA-guided pseudouridylation complex pseudouridine synthase subunit Cbf5 [Nanoarchaeota archaeon]